MKEDLGPILRRHRLAAKVSQTLIAKRIGCTQAQISAWEKGGRRVTPQYRNLIEQHYNLSESEAKLLRAQQPPSRLRTRKVSKETDYLPLIKDTAASDLTYLTLSDLHILLGYKILKQKKLNPKLITEIVEKHRVKR